MSLGQKTKDSEGWPRSTFDIQDRLVEFHRAMNIPILPTPQVPADERVRLRARLIVEECCEFIEACFRLGPQESEYLHVAIRGYLERTVDSANVFVNLPEAADALADIAYVVEGANLEFGIDSGPVLDEVHRANMAKFGGPVREDGKRLKPAGWTPPDIAGVLAEQQR